MKVLVTGGAGYIGSITAYQLVQEGFEVVILDQKISGRKLVVSPDKAFEGSTLDQAFVEKLLKEQRIDAVIHFAAWIEAGESMKEPGRYFENNIFNTLRLLEAMRNCNIDKVVFSSTAAVYGIPEVVPIKEDSQKAPINPYGESKLMAERLLGWYSQVHKVRHVILRYFNAAGALLDGSVGESHEPETHLIPNVIKAALNDSSVSLFGNDYPTTDGTCVRDYIHVLDLANAHIAALQALQSGHASDVYNVGTGSGYSNKEVIEMVQKVSGKIIQVNHEPRRPGDPPALIADASKLKQEFGWQPKFSDLETIIQSAWKWHTKR